MEKVTLAPTTVERLLNQETIEWQKQAYGMTEKEMCKDLDMLVNMQRFHCLDEREMFTTAAMSILSDAQEAIEHDQKEMGRQFINKAKWLIMYHARR